MLYTPRDELISRIARLQSLLVANQIDCALVRQNANLYYYSGTIQDSHLFIPAVGQPSLMVHRDYMRARLESRLERVIPLHSLRQIPDRLREGGIRDLRTLGLELDLLPASLYLGYRELLTGTQLVDSSRLFREVRMIKTAWEVARIEEAAEQADLMFRTARATLREGMSEIELAAEVEREARLHGHPGLVRMRSWNADYVFGYLLSGLHAAIPAHVDAIGGGVGLSPALGQGASYRRIGRGEPVLLDVVACVDGYVADQTRILVIGPAPARLRETYEAMRAIYGEVCAAARPGVLCRDLHELAVRLAAEKGYGDFFMGPKEARHAFVGHGIGVELDELPVLAPRVNTPLAEGMVIAIEPKAIIPGFGTIGIENSHVVVKDGTRTLTFSEEELAVV